MRSDLDVLPIRHHISKYLLRRGGSVFEPTDNVQHRSMRRSGSAFEPDITNSGKPTYTNLPRQVELRNLTYD